MGICHHTRTMARTEDNPIRLECHVSPVAKVGLAVLGVCLEVDIFSAVQRIIRISYFAARESGGLI